MKRIRRTVAAGKCRVSDQTQRREMFRLTVVGSGLTPVGVVLGILGGNAVAYFMKMPAAIPFDWIAIGLVICSIVGVVFGTYPAYKAANLDPIESLRYE